MSVDVIPEHGVDSSIVTFDLTVGLRVIRRCEYVCESEQREYGLEESRDELFYIIRYQRLWRSVFKHPRLDERYRNRIGIDPSQSNNESQLGKNDPRLRAGIDDPSWFSLTVRVCQLRAIRSGE